MELSRKALPEHIKALGLILSATINNPCMSVYVSRRKCMIAPRTERCQRQDKKGVT